MNSAVFLLATTLILQFTGYAVAVLATCSVYGDLHYRTFDNAFIDYQGTCKHQLVDICGVTSEPKFQVYMKGENRYGSSDVSWAQYVEVADNGHIIRITRNSDGSVSARVDGVLVTLPYDGTVFTLKADYGSILYTSSNVQVRFNGFSAYVTVDSVYAGLTCGMCGNFNADVADDFVPKGGSTPVAQDTAGETQLGDSWIVPDSEATCAATTAGTPCNPTADMLSRCDALTVTSTYATCTGISATMNSLYASCQIDICFIANYPEVVTLFNMFIEQYVIDVFPDCCLSGEQCDSYCTSSYDGQLPMGSNCTHYCQCSLGNGCVKRCPPSVDPNVPICVENNIFCPGF